MSRVGAQHFTALTIVTPTHQLFCTSSAASEWMEDRTVNDQIGLSDVQAVYNGAEGDLWELIMGQQIHIGGLKSSQDLASRAKIAKGSRGVDLCCCNGAGMRFLVRFCEVASMTGVDATATVIARGKSRCAAEGMGDRIRFIEADVCASGLPDNAADFVWGEDAWCYVIDKTHLVREAMRICRPGGTIAFTDWVIGNTAPTDAELARVLAFMKFPNMQSLSGYRQAFEQSGGIVIEATDTERFAPYVDLYLAMVDQQFTYDALRLLNFNGEMLAAIAGEMIFMRDLARAGKLAQGRFIVQKPA